MIELLSLTDYLDKYRVQFDAMLKEYCEDSKPLARGHPADFRGLQTMLVARMTQPDRAFVLVALEEDGPIGFAAGEIAGTFVTLDTIFVQHECRYPKTNAVVEMGLFLVAAASKTGKHVMVVTSMTQDVFERMVARSDMVKSVHMGHLFKLEVK